MLIFVLLVLSVISFRATHQNEKRPAIAAPRVAFVRITEDGFSPAALKINAGTEVVWTNSDTEIHSIEAAIGSKYPSLNSNTNLDTNGTYRYTFDQKGKYNYHDKLNPTMNGSVTVE